MKGEKLPDFNVAGELVEVEETNIDTNEEDTAFSRLENEITKEMVELKKLLQ